MLQTGFTWSTFTGKKPAHIIRRYTKGNVLYIGPSTCYKSWASVSQRWRSWTGSRWARPFSLASTQTSPWPQRGQYGPCLRWFKTWPRVLLFLTGHNWVRSWCWMPLPPEQERLDRQVKQAGPGTSVHKNVGHRNLFLQLLLFEGYFTLPPQQPILNISSYVNFCLQNQRYLPWLPPPYSS